MRLLIRSARLAFPQLWVASALDDTAKPAYSAQLILDAASTAEVLKTLHIVAVERWEGKGKALCEQLIASDRTCLHDTANKRSYAGFDAPGYYLSARSAARPLVIDRDRAPLAEADGRPYAGCYVHAAVDIWAQDNAKGKRINAALRGVQFARDGEAFGGGGPASADEFEGLEALAIGDSLEADLGIA